MSSSGRFKHIIRFINVGKRLPTFLGMLITLSVLWLQLSAPTFVDDFIQRLEYLVYDQRLAIMPKAVKSPENKIVIVAGYQGVTDNGDITTLGRGGSDLTAVALALTLKAKVCEIYTDVSGIYTTDPRVTANVRKIKVITFEEMLEMASLGAQVMQARSIELAKRYNIPIHVRSSFSKEEGTMIVRKSNKLEEVNVQGVTSSKSEAKITICAVPDQPGIAAKIFTEISKTGASVDIIVQNVSHTRHTDISFTVPKTHLTKAFNAAKIVAKKIKAGEVQFDNNIARISIIGSGMRSHHGIAAAMFQTLAKSKINIEMISTSEISISCIIAQSQVVKAVKALHKEFKLDKGKR